MKMLAKDQMKSALHDLIMRYNKYIRYSSYNGKKQVNKAISEETIRVWLNEFLSIFGWDVKDTRHVLQEYVLRGTEQRRLNDINSTHRRPDYTLINGANIKTFLDAKSLNVDIRTDINAAYQIRSYGWSAQVPCSFVSNFEQFAIFDTRWRPDPSQPVDYGVTFLNVDEYIEKFDILYDHLCFTLVCSNYLEKLYSRRAIEGKTKVDEEFSRVLSEFRLELAKDLVKLNPGVITSDSQLNYYTQIILDRIIYIRVCESKGIEEIEKLKKFFDSPIGFWKEFKRSCYAEFHNHYDGAMFSHDALFQSLNVSNRIIKDFIDRLYYPYPYKFDVIPVKVIANIYEEFLSTSLE